MASFNYNGNTYYYSALGKWVDSDNKPVDFKTDVALRKLYSEKEVKAKNKEAKKATLKKRARYNGGSYVLSSDSKVSASNYSRNWHKKAKELPYNGNIRLTDDQKRALAILESGNNVFLTGEAGTGKSFVLQEFMHRNKDKNIIVCAFTGVAAINVGGSTIHRVFKAPLGVIKPEEFNAEPPEAVIKADIIVIDEISMCRIDLFEYVVRTIRYADEKKQEDENVKALNEGRAIETICPKQLIVVGDFYQLAPVITDKDGMALQNFWSRRSLCDGFAFASSLWEELGFKNVVLKEIVRQSGDPDYIENLNKIRRGDKSGLEWFNDSISRTPIPDGIFLCGRNDQANAINKEKSDALPGNYRIYSSKTVGTVGDGDKMTFDELALKVGMQVMTLVNDTKEGYQNGSIGKIIALYDDHVEVRLNSGRLVDVVEYEWEINGFEVQGKKVERVILGKFVQIPLKTAYAITIHKSQGQTYSSVNVSPDCFAAGQLYVALSRAQTAKGMSISRHITDNSLLVNRYVKTFYDSLVEDEGHGVVMNNNTI